LLEVVAGDLQEQAGAKGHRLTLEFCEDKPFVQGDRTLLMQLASNLLSNAIKYTPEDGHICVETQIVGEMAVVRFQDTGVGISEKDLPMIFEKFFRVQSEETRDVEGTGLGLAIVKSIVENHNGTIEVHSVVGKGSSFDVRLPLHFSA
jgi:signal transduction histidine kinase